MLCRGCREDRAKLSWHADSAVMCVGWSSIISGAWHSSAWLDPGPYFGNPWDQPCPGDASRQSFRLEHHDGTDRDFQYQDQSGKHDPVLEELS